ncbi:hypothetical protein Pla123a_28790 [Posidoniimonas polymericola]|uniref:Uncharacterized protein n=1 Tax=Posidoniimonas polymericola TaxID=2528002 RepID=A0A5C5YMN3_9BACT|nr:hypothetical protein [Posidoniimonas polymericola]TWT76090.1 hypothetical protein Pla123a_28790 [Posidoniimonas polymericola]
MATAALRTRTLSPVSTPSAPAWRDPHSSLPEIVGSAREELAEGNFENAWSGFQIALDHWLRVKWVEHSGKPGSPIAERFQLVDKLTSGCALDDWTNKAIRLVLTRPLPVEAWHAEVVAALVTALAVDGVDSAPKLAGNVRRQTLEDSCRGQRAASGALTRGGMPR